MIFENSTIRQFGENSLIINYKAKVFFDGQKLEKEDLVALTMEASHITGVPLVR